MKRQEFLGTVYYSHFNYLIRSFWGGVIGLVVGMLLGIVGIGFIILFIVGIWYLVRVIYAFIKVLDNKAVNDQSWLI